MKKRFVITFAVLFSLMATVPARAECRWNEDEGIAAEWDGYPQKTVIELYKGSSDYEANRISRATLAAEKKSKDYTQTIIDCGPGTYTCVIKDTDGCLLVSSEPFQVGEAYYTELLIGHVKPSWQSSNGCWFLIDPAGNRLKGWHKVDEKWYYMSETSGVCLINRRTPDGYYVDETGAWDGGPSIYQ